MILRLLNLYPGVGVHLHTAELVFRGDSKGVPIAVQLLRWSVEEKDFSLYRCAERQPYRHRSLSSNYVSAP